MIRFANPGSDISSFTRIYQALFEELRDTQPFSLDDISAALVRRNLATSCGFAGPEALSRSTRTDRTRDPIFNQSKMYSELFRLLGWLHPTVDSRQSFMLTWLGAHVATAGPHAKPLVNECLLGIAVPNEVLSSKGEYRMRPFALLLRTLDALGGLLCRDEMIVGPLSLEDDGKPTAVKSMLSRLRALRNAGPKELAAAVAKLATQRDIQVNTLENYTRFPLAVLEWSGWTAKSREAGPYGRSMVFHRLTPKGIAAVQVVKDCVDVRGELLEAASDEVCGAAAKLGAISMLERAGFEVESFTAERATWCQLLTRKGLLATATQPMLFSPFQELKPDEVRRIFGPVVGGGIGAPAARLSHVVAEEVGRSQALTTKVRLLKQSAKSARPPSKGSSKVEIALRTSLSSGATIGEAADQLTKAYATSNKNDFYPAIAALFQVLDYKCEVTRVGVNYQRWDAFLTHPVDSVPIEIKSPGEERFISVKGVRQALENKVILLARRSAPTRRETTSLVVGYEAPNDRAEVAGLVSDIHGAFGVTIGVIDFRSLALLGAGALSGTPHDAQSLLSLKGFIDVAPV